MSKKFLLGSYIAGFGFGTLSLAAAVVMHQSSTRQEGAMLMITSPGMYQAAKAAMLVGGAAWLYGLIVALVAAIQWLSGKN